MEAITAAILRTFFERLAQRLENPATLYLLGGSALCLLGSARVTLDVDYDLELPPDESAQVESIIADLAREMRLDVEPVPLAQFVPLPPHAFERRRHIGRYGELDVCIFDLYSIALSKIARGFETDLEDVQFLLRTGLIEFVELERHFAAILPAAAAADIDPAEFSAFFAEVRQQYHGR
jgi:hypothetical protein